MSNFGAPKSDAPSFNFGSAGGDAKVPAKASLFGTPTQQSALGGFGLKTTASTGFALGAAPTLNFGSPATSTSATSINFNVGGASTPSTGFTLGGGAAVTPTTKPPSFGASIGNTFALGGTAAASTPSTGFSLGGATTATVAPMKAGFSTPATVSSSIGSILGMPPLATSAANTTPASTGLGFSLGTTTIVPVISSSTPSTGSTPAKISSTGLSFGTPTAASTGTFTLGTTTPATALPTTGITPTTVIPSSGTMTYLQLEDAINKWTMDLEEQGTLFGNQARQINAWDRLLISNGEKVLSLSQGIEKVKQQQQQLDQELDFVLAQQKELEDLIVPLENELKTIAVTDVDRNHTYQLAENMDTQLKQMSEDLKEIIEQLNESNKTQEMSNPITQIGKILNAHMNSLQWVDRNTSKITTHLDQISKLHDLNRRNHEINLQKTYD